MGKMTPGLGSSSLDCSVVEYVVARRVVVERVVVIKRESLVWECATAEHSNSYETRP